VYKEVYLIIMTWHHPPVCRQRFSSCKFGILVIAKSFFGLLPSLKVTREGWLQPNQMCHANTLCEHTSTHKAATMSGPCWVLYAFQLQTSCMAQVTLDWFPVPLTLSGSLPLILNHLEDVLPLRHSWWLCPCLPSSVRADWELYWTLTVSISIISN